MIVRCPDCAQELTDTTEVCPRCGCHALSKRLELEYASKSSFQKFYESLKTIALSRYSPFFFWFSFSGFLDRAQFLVSRIYSCSIFFAVFHAVKKQILPETFAHDLPVCGTVFCILLILDIPVLWKRARMLGWPRVLSAAIVTLAGFFSFTNLLIVNVFARYIWFLLNAAMFAFSSFEESRRS